MLHDFVRDASVFEKGLFLMIAGVCFVFVVQFVFFLIVKVWMGRKHNGIV